jgi:coenzyme F420-reducing hydrogenase beta subunit
MFFLETKNKRDCYGCRACEKKCPEHCIKMFYDEEGFSYPVINESLCKHCGLCKFVCPNDNIDLLIKNNKIDKPIGYMAIHKNTYIRFKSASGGAFSAIVERLSKENIIVFGAELDQYFKAIHSYADTIQGAHKFRKSKYIQSDIGDSYRQAECFLKKGKNVLFTGTPCQVAGLKLYLQKEYINLFTADFVCRGVPSQNVFDLYLLYLRKRYGGGEITYFTFRYKTYSKLQKWNSRNIKAVLMESP